MRDRRLSWELRIADCEERGCTPRDGRQGYGEMGWRRAAGRASARGRHRAQGMARGSMFGMWSTANIERGMGHSSRYRLAGEVAERQTEVWTCQELAGACGQKRQACGNAQNSIRLDTHSPHSTHSTHSHNPRVLACNPRSAIHGPRSTSRSQTSFKVRARTRPSGSSSARGGWFLVCAPSINPNSLSPGTQFASSLSLRMRMSLARV